MTAHGNIAPRPEFHPVDPLRRVAAMTAYSPIRLMSRDADAVETVYLPDSNIEATGYFHHDTELGADRVFHASLIGLLVDDTLLDADEAVKWFGLKQVAIWEKASVAKANGDEQ